MAKSITLLEQHLGRQPPTVVIRATTWWEAVHAHVKLQECGLGVIQLVEVCWNLNSMYVHTDKNKCILQFNYTLKTLLGGIFLSAIEGFYCTQNA